MQRIARPDSGGVYTGGLIGVEAQHIGKIRITFKSLLGRALCLETPGHLTKVADSGLHEGGTMGPYSLCGVNIILLIDVILILIQFVLGLTLEESILVAEEFHVVLLGSRAVDRLPTARN